MPNMHPQHGKGFANPYDPNASRVKLSRSLRRLNRLIESGQLQPGDPIPGSWLRQACGVWSTYQQELFLTESALEYDAKADLYRVPQQQAAAKQERPPLAERIGNWLERNARY